ncbi:MAG: cobalamin biosynthesis protein CobD [Lachnospiraceae bacterium]|nr:cobalamin biosynthesis protein CobD [Lachnospiraceae bacterium]MBQ2320743.1 cobalamin biosynthesis protein CobD [Lachnospiraceae bacterium]
MLYYSILACLIGFILDLIIGDPRWIYHPVRLIGKLIEVTERLLRKIFPDTEKGLLVAGGFLVLIVSGISTGIIFCLVYFSYRANIYAGIAVESILSYFILATKSLKVESMKVYEKLKEKDLEGSRYAVSMIVGRDTASLDEKGVTKAAVETVAENLSDGVIAPMIFLLIGGSVFGTFYKAINTMDSMVGYKNDKYIYFGRAAAKMDDFVNFIPARISAVMLILGSGICGKDIKNAVKIFRRDRYNHSSPNSAQTESVCAGALRIRLAGDAFYFGKLVKKPYIGDDLSAVTPENIKDVNQMMYASAILTMLIFGGLFTAVYSVFGRII